MPTANWVATIPHGYPLDRCRHFPGESGNGNYLAFLGRITPGEGIDTAIGIARSDAQRAVERRLIDKRRPSREPRKPVTPFGTDLNIPPVPEDHK